MGRNLTHWNADVAIYNISINNLQQAKSLQEELMRKLYKVESRIVTCIVAGPSSIRESEDLRNDLSITEDYVLGEEGLLHTYSELAIQIRLLKDLINNWDEAKPECEWGHGGYDIYGNYDEWLPD